MERQVVLVASYSHCLLLKKKVQQWHRNLIAGRHHPNQQLFDINTVPPSNEVKLFFGNVISCKGNRNNNNNNETLASSISRNLRRHGRRFRKLSSSSSFSSLPEPTQWYPNWLGGTNIYLPDTFSTLPAAATSAYSFAAAGSNDFLLGEEPPAYMAQQNLMKNSRDECCNSCYWWDMADCVEGSPVLIIGDGDDGGGSISSSVASGNFGGHEEIVYSEGGLGGVGEAENSIGSGGSVADGESKSGEAAALDNNSINNGDDAVEGEDVDGGPSALAGDTGEVEQQQQTQQTQPKQNQPQQQQEPLPPQRLPPYGGSLEWYADYSHFKCVQDW